MSPLKKIVKVKISFQSYLAASVRRYDAKVLILIGLVATVFAISTFIADKISERKSSSKSDTLLKIRFSSPSPAKDIIIVDVDERSLALLSKTKGNWPWPRDTLADGIQKISDLGARAILFNVMMSDFDRRNPNADAAMEMTAGLIRPIGFPIIRLNPQNDAESKFKVANLNSVEWIEKNQTATIALIHPAFPTMMDRLGVADQRPDKDGIIRSYPLNWVEADYKLPSIVKATMISAGMDVKSLPDQLTLNWRNKKGVYKRISFADVMAINEGSSEALALKDAFVVLGVSAPGIGQIKPTAVKSIEDDNEILATALDDAVNDTFFRTAPGWALLIVTIILIWGIIFLGVIRVAPVKINQIFVILQASLAGITLIAVSYTTILVDLSGPMSFALLVFAGVKIVRMLSDSSSRGKPGYRKLDAKSGSTEMILVGFRRNIIGFKKYMQWEKKCQNIVGIRNIIRIDDLFGGASFLGKAFEEYTALIILADSIKQLDEVLLVFSNENINTYSINQTKLKEGLDINGTEFQSIVAAEVTKNVVSVFSEESFKSL
jgi:adenylate cyclase